MNIKYSSKDWAKEKIQDQINDELDLLMKQIEWNDTKEIEKTVKNLKALLAAKEQNDSPLVALKELNKIYSDFNRSHFDISNIRQIIIKGLK